MQPPEQPGAADVSFDGPATTSWSDVISGAGGLIKDGTGTLVLTGTNTYTGGTTINKGVLQLGDGGTTGSIIGDVKNYGSLVFDRSDDVSFKGIVSGSGYLRQAGTGTVTLTGANTYTGGTTISAGTLRLGNGGTIGSIKGDVRNNGTLAFDRSDNIGFTGTVTGTGSLVKAGDGALTLTGTNGYTGTTQVSDGSLYVDGDQSAATGMTTVANGATLGGKGALGGDVTVADGATLAPGGKDAIGTLTVSGNLKLSAGSALDYGFGGQLGALIDVKGNLTLDGTLNVSNAPGDDLGPGVYHLINYGGALVNNGLNLGNSISGLSVQTGVAHQVNLIDTQGMAVSFWDGDAGPKGNHAVNGGNGIWESGNALSNNNWTDASGAINASFGDRSFVVFQATPGTVTVDDGNGDINAAGMQFASNGYVVQGDAINLVGGVGDSTLSIIRVGDGTTAGAGYTATINSVFDGTSALVKTDAGTLVLGGANAYIGGTTISGGTLQIGNGGATGSIIGDVADNSRLAFNRSDDTVFDGIVSGIGSLTQAGTGTLILTGNNTYSGGTTVSDGILQIGNGGAAGWITGNIVNNKYVRFDRDDDVIFSGNISGTGSLLKDGAGTLILTGSNTYDSTDTYSNPTTITTGTLQIGNGGTTGSIVGDVTNNASLVFDRSDKVIFDGKVTGTGLLTQAGTGTLILRGNVYSHGITISRGTLQVGNGGTTGSIFGDVIDNGSLVFDYGDSHGTMHGYEDVISGSGRVVKSGQGVLILTGSNTYTGGTTISGGTLQIGQLGGLIGTVGSIIGDVTDNGLLRFARSDDLTFDGVIHGNGSLEQAGTGILSLAGANTYTGGTTVSLGTLQIGNGGTTGSIAGDVINNTYYGSLTFNRSDDMSYGGAISGSGKVVKLGHGTLTMSGVNTFTGGLLVNEGVLKLITGAAMATGIVVGGAGRNASLEVAEGAMVSGPVYVEDQGMLDNAGNLEGGVSGFSNSLSGPHGSLNMINAGDIVGDVQMDPTVINNIKLIAGGYIHGALKIGANAQSTLTLDGSAGTTQLYSNAVTGKTTFGGVLAKNGAGTWAIDDSDLQGVVKTSINAGSLRATQTLSGDVTVNDAGNLDGVPGVAGELTNAGKVTLHGGDSIVEGNYTQSSSGALAVSLGSKLDVAGSATLNGGTLEVTGADNGYVSNAHTNVVTAIGGVTGTFGQLVKDTGVVFTATIINYDANSVWLDTTGLDVTTAAAGNGVSYTPASFGSARRVQGAFEQLDARISAGKLASVSSDFVRAAGQFQQAPTLQAAQASLQSLSGQLHAASAAMTFEAIDASSRALSDRFDSLLDKGAGFGMWTGNLSVSGDMARAGFDDVGFKLNGWLVGSDRQIGHSGVAGFAFGRSQGRQRLNRSVDHDSNRNTEAMLYAGALNGSWYTQGRVGFGRFQQDVSRQLLLGESAQGVWTQYGGSYDVAYGESGLHFGGGNSHITPFVDVQYARVNRDGFTEQGAGGFGLRSKAQTLDRWQAGLGVRAGHHWNLEGGRAVDLSGRAQWQRTLASHGDVFDASFVGLQQWQPIAGICLSRYSGLFGLAMEATLSARTALTFNYDYQTGQRNQAQMLSARLNVVF